MRKKTKFSLNLSTLTLEGNLFIADQLAKVVVGKAQWQTDADYQLLRGLRAKDEYSRAFQIARALWLHYSPGFNRRDGRGEELTQAFVKELLQDVFGYQLNAYSHIVVDEREYPITWLADDVPIVVAPASLGLDEPDQRFAVLGTGSRKKSAFQVAQECLNASDDHLWAIVCNGRQLRLLRDSATLTRPAYLEVDLESLFNNENFAEFANIWRILHVSRSKPAEGQCIWEAWRQAGQEEGARVRDGLRDGVTAALLTLGTGFLAHPDNTGLREKLQQGALSKDEYFQQLLRLIYRLIFLFCLEERGLLHPANSKAEAVRAYSEGYALARLREKSLRRSAKTRHTDLWQAARIVFLGLVAGEPQLALPALGGLFTINQCPDLDHATLTNACFLKAMESLRWAVVAGSKALVDYRNMGSEELGSVYESLLELVPEISLENKTFSFIGFDDEGNTAGNARKLTGSYYTPDSLVQELIKSALDPVIEARLKEHADHPIEALLRIRVCDPACGSGHFLLAAARRLAEKLALLRTLEGAVKPADYRHALREVVTHCIFGVDKNPMAIELARMALWLEAFEEGRPLSFLDHHLRCGDALLGIVDLAKLEEGIANEAYKPLSGDDKERCKVLSKENANALKQIRNPSQKQSSFDFESKNVLASFAELEALPEDTTADIAAKEQAFNDFWAVAAESRLVQAADVAVGAYLLPKTTAAVPTSATLYLLLRDEQLTPEQLDSVDAAQKACRDARVLHWPVAFPQVFAAGGFDCVLANPPWERIKLQEQEYFASRCPEIANAKNKAEREKYIKWLSEGTLHARLSQGKAEFNDDPAEVRLYQEFLDARRVAEAASLFAHVKKEDGGRYPLTGVGDVNLYALFAETIAEITLKNGGAGFIVPSGIATDDSTKRYFQSIVANKRLVSLLGFDNAWRLFPAVHSDTPFSLVTLGVAEQAVLAHYILSIEQLADHRRRFTLSADEFRLINPNTLTCPIFRSERDAGLTKKIYGNVPVLVNENLEKGNPWGIVFSTMFHMSNDSDLFQDKAGQGLLPLYEAKLIHQFDHRWATYGVNGKICDVTTEDKADPEFQVKPRYWINQELVEERLREKNWKHGWLMGWRDITNATNERTVIASVLPRSGVGHTLPLFVLNQEPKLFACFLANMNSMVLDYCARLKIGGVHLTYGYLKQFPILPPTRYTDADLAFIVPRVLELTYTATDLKPWAQDLGYEGEPFVFDPQRRALIRAELDACYAKLYGLTRDELRYILDPAEVMGEDYPSETFRVLKEREIKEYGEYRTRRLVLEAWDKLS